MLANTPETCIVPPMLRSGKFLVTVYLVTTQSAFCRLIFSAVSIWFADPKGSTADPHVALDSSITVLIYSRFGASEPLALKVYQTCYICQCVVLSASVECCDTHDTIM